jgi:hypothetical protein
MTDNPSEIRSALRNLGITAGKLADRIADCVNEVDDRIRIKEFVRSELAWVDRLIATWPVNTVKDRPRDPADDAYDTAFTDGWNAANEKWRASLAAAGVEVKE